MRRERIMKKVAINGFGRIGRNVLRALLETPRTDFEIAVINDLTTVETSASLLELDSTHGRLNQPLTAGNGFIEIGGSRITYLSEHSPEACRWGDYGIDLVMECSGIFTEAAVARAHIDAVGTQRKRGHQLLGIAHAAGADKGNAQFFGRARQ